MDKREKLKEDLMVLGLHNPFLLSNFRKLYAFNADNISINEIVDTLSEKDFLLALVQVKNTFDRINKHKQEKNTMM
jgi:hypothetical protein